MHCDNNIDDCSVGTCLNGGKCKDYLNNFFCDCPQSMIIVVCVKFLFLLFSSAVFKEKVEVLS